MPFTPSHAVVALPFVRTPLAPAAVAVGAMAPDLPLFLPGTPLDYATTHDLAGLPLTLCVALVLLLVWRMLLRPAVRELSPRAIARRLPAAWDGGPVAAMRETFARRGGRHPSWAGLALVVAALAIGVVSHIVWDEFTHEGRAGSALLPALGGQWGPWPGYRWLQYGSSVVGLAVLAAAALVWLRRSAADAAPVRRVLPTWARAAWLASLVVVAGAGVVALAPAGPEFTPTYLAYRILVPMCTGWAVLTLALALLVQLLRRLRPRPRSA